MNFKTIKEKFENAKSEQKKIEGFIDFTKEKEYKELRKLILRRRLVWGIISVFVLLIALGIGLSAEEAIITAISSLLAVSFPLGKTIQFARILV